MPPSPTSAPACSASMNGCPPLFILAMTGEHSTAADKRRSMRYSMPVSLPPDQVAASEPFEPAREAFGLGGLFRLAAVWRGRVDRPARRAAVAIGVASVFALAHLARI